MTPYRAGGPGGPRCPTCGAERSPDARACAQCGTEIPAVRCPACMTLNVVGSAAGGTTQTTVSGESACRQCGAELVPEPEQVATSLLCPRGCGGLVATLDISECERCGGIFIPNETLADLVTQHRGQSGERKSSIVPPAPAPDAVVYLPCPSCNARMNRTVFGKSSGVIVDVCRVHGTWFDARELTASLAFVERGGLELVEKREKERKEEEKRKARIEGRTEAFALVNRSAMRGFDPDASDRAEALRDLIDVLLSL